MNATTVATEITHYSELKPHLKTSLDLLGELPRLYGAESRALRAGRE